MRNNRGCRQPAALILASIWIATSVVTLPLHAEPDHNPARLVDLGSADTDLLNKDLGNLLAAARYSRSIDDPRAPRNRVVPVRQIGDALRTHDGVAHVALAERIDGTDRIALKALYVVEGGTETPPGAAVRRPAPGTEGRGAVRLDLGDESGQALLASLGGHLEALETSASPSAGVPVDDVLNALESPGRVAYVVLTDPAADPGTAAARVFVVPDVLSISIRDDVAAAKTNIDGGSASGPAPQVELVPHPDGGPPMLKFEFDPRQYDNTGRQ